MIRDPTNATPHDGNHGAGIERKGKRAYLATASAKYGNPKSARIPANWRDRLPEPAAFYGKCVAKLGKPNCTGWAQGVCPFHDDHNKSLSVCVTGGHGGWRCFASCGGGDLVGFHSRLRGLDFQAAVRDLIGGNR
jgi:hypothetical protein